MAHIKDNRVYLDVIQFDSECGGESFSEIKVPACSNSNAAGGLRTFEDFDSLRAAVVACATSQKVAFDTL